MAETPMIRSVEELRKSPFTEDELNELVDRVRRYTIFYGMHNMNETNGYPAEIIHRPITLFPSPMPRKVFVEAKRLHPYFQTLMYKVANNHEFLYDCFKRVLPVDDFIRALWDIYDTVRQEGPDQISFMLTRNDFLIEAEPDRSCDMPCDFQFKQVEFNSFAAGAAGMAAAAGNVHRHCLALSEIPFKPEQLPDNNPSLGLARGMCKAWELYNKPKSVILFVVELTEPITDQQMMESDIFQMNPQVLVIHRTIERLREQARLTDGRELFVGNKEIAVVYFRHGYSPEQYTKKDYKVRLNIERSKAIKCPSVAQHLAGCKKVQQVLSEPGVLEQFLDDASVISAMRKTFVGQVGLDQDKTIIEKVKANPERYVLKPQREGGGNNLFGKELLAEVDTIYNSEQAPSWIVMDKIYGRCQRNRFVRVGFDWDVRNVVNEFGIFGVHIGTPTEELVNFECGHLIRTKPEESDEGGMCVGIGSYDSPFLIG